MEDFCASAHHYTIFLGIPGTCLQCMFFNAFHMYFILFHIMFSYVYYLIIQSSFVIICHGFLDPFLHVRWGCSTCRPLLGTLAAEGWLLLSLVFTAELPHHVLANVLNTESVWMLCCIVLYFDVFCNNSTTFLGKHLNKQACNIKHTVAV
jgi:hypothetical protein